MKSRTTLFISVLLWGFGFSFTAFAGDEGTVFIVRHAEKESTASNALLSALGHKRAGCLAQTLKDANIQTIFTSDVKRTQQTAQPLADRRHLAITVVPKKDPTELIQKARAAAKKGDVLIVGHQETVAGIVQQLGGGTVPPVSGSEFDRLMIVHLDADGGTVTTLRYCDCGLVTNVPSEMKQGMEPNHSMTPAATPR